MAARSTGGVTPGLPRKIRPPNPPPKATVFAAIRGLTATAFIGLPIFLLSIRTMGYRGEECSGGRTLLRTHGEKLQLARGISAKSRNSSVALGELGVEMAEREGFALTG